MPNLQGLYPGDRGYVQTPTPQMGTDITSPPTSQQPVGSQNTLTPQQISELNVAAGRNNATDQANLAYAKSHYGFTPDIKPANLSTDTNETALAQGPNPQPSSVTVLGQQVAASGLTAIQQSLTDYLGQQQKITEQQQTAAQAESDTALAGLESATAVSNLDTLKGLEQSAGLEDKRKALTDIMAQINSYKGALEQGLINIEGQPIAMDFIVGQQALLQRQAAAKINTLVAQGALVQDNLNFAIDTVTRYYQAASQDRQDQIERYKTLFTIANDKLIRLDKKEESFVNAQIRILEDADTQQQKDKDKILDLMKSNPDAFKKANISLDQPYEKILQAMLPYMGGTAGDFQSVEVNGRLFTFDKTTGKYTDSGVSVPKQSVGGGGNTDYAANLTALNQTKGSDGFVNTDTYKQLRQSSKDKSGFDKNFSWMLNPKDASAQDFFLSRELAPDKRYTATTIPQDVVTSLNDDIAGGAGLDQLYVAYPEVSPALVQSYYYNQ